MFCNGFDIGSCYGFLNQIGMKNREGAIHLERLDIPIDDLLSHINSPKTPLQFFLETTEMSLINLITKDELTDYFWMRFYQPNDSWKISIYKNDMLFNMCPDCIKEDMKRVGTPIIHRSHQLPYVKACHIHGMKLSRYYFSAKSSVRIEFERYEEQSDEQISELDIRFAKFMEDLSKLNIGLSTNELIKNLNSKIASYPVSHFIQDVNDSKLMLLYNKYYLNENGYVLKDDNQEDLFKLLYFVYKRANNIEIEPSKHQVQEFNRLIRNRFELKNQYNNWLIELYCEKCGRLFITTPRLIAYGNECPHCQSKSKTHHKSLAKNMCKLAYKGKYKFLNYSNENKLVSVYDIKKKKYLDIDYYKFMSKHPRSNTKRNFDDKSKWKFYSNYGDHHGYHKNELVTIYDSKEYFLKLVFDLVGDEYQISDEYIDLFTPIEIVHALCKHKLKIIPYLFMNGQRCPFCKVHHKPNEIITILSEYMSSNISLDVKFDDYSQVYLYRVFVYDYQYKVAMIKNIYQFTEETLLQEIFRYKNSDNDIFKIFNKAALYRYFYSAKENSNE